VKGYNIVHQIIPEPDNICLLFLADYKFIPGKKQILHGNYIFKTMGQLSFHKNSNLSTPPQGNLDADKLPIVIKLSTGYKQWHEYFIAIPRHTRYTIGGKIDSLFADCLELSLMAGYAPREKKSEVVRRLSVKFDALKFFLKLLWEIKALDNKKYITLSSHLNEIGKMVGGWMKMLG
jgi:hypothetical protein